MSRISEVATLEAWAAHLVTTTPEQVAGTGDKHDELYDLMLNFLKEKFPDGIVPNGPMKILRTECLLDLENLIPIEVLLTPPYNTLMDIVEKAALIGYAAGMYHEELEDLLVLPVEWG